MPETKWVAMVGQWDEEEDSPEYVYWFKTSDSFDEAKANMLRQIGEFISCEVNQSSPCLSCVITSSEELASLARHTAGPWRGNIDGDDFVITETLVEELDAMTTQYTPVQAAWIPMNDA